MFEGVDILLKWLRWLALGRGEVWRNAQREAANEPAKQPLSQLYTIARWCVPVLAQVPGYSCFCALLFISPRPPRLEPPVDGCSLVRVLWRGIASRCSTPMATGSTVRQFILDAPSLHRYGCIPVIISDDYQLPLDGMLDWSAFSVRIAERDLAKTPGLLENIPERQRKAMRSALQAAAPALTWSRPSQTGDAFHHIMLQLWRKRHVTRYKGT